MDKKLSSLKIHNIIVCAIILIIFVIFGVINTNAEEVNKKEEVLPSNRIRIGYSYRKLIEEKQKQEVNKFNILDAKKEEIKFFSDIFDYDYEEILEDLTNINQNEFNEYNIGLLTDKSGNLLKYNSFEYGLIEYFYNLNNSNKIKKPKYVPYTGDSSYIENLIIYFSTIYNNVDTKLLLSIGAAESGYYKVKYMLNYNNVYGGMSSKGLIKYNNIELGTLSYVRMMSKNYYAKGLTTKYSIGKVYCPVINNGVKNASPHWINLIDKALNKYNSYDTNIELKNI